MSKHSLYILSGTQPGPVFIGSTSDLAARLYQHRSGKVSHLVSRIDRLVYVETCDCGFKAEARVRALRATSREWLDALITSRNPSWHDLLPAPIEEAIAA